VVELKRGEAKFVLSCVTSFASEFERGVVAVLAEELPGIEPPEVREVREQLQLLQRQLESRQSTIRVHEVMVGLIKRVLASERRRVAEGLDRPLSRATEPGVVKALQARVLRYDAFMAREPFATARAQRIPRLTDFMSIRFAAEAMRDAPKLAPRVYDEKFHILETPRLFLTDLAYYRHECGLRDAELAVAYVDIDDFKAINSRLTETVVDLLVLGPFLELVEAWSFGHGHAYRFNQRRGACLHRDEAQRCADTHGFEMSVGGQRTTILATNTSALVSHCGSTCDSRLASVCRNSPLRGADRDEAIIARRCFRGPRGRLRVGNQ
jgi:GGDEF domain-containing protein